MFIEFLHRGGLAAAERLDGAWETSMAQQLLSKHGCWETGRSGPVIRHPVDAPQKDAVTIFYFS